MIRLALLGLDGIQQHWLDALSALVAAGDVELTAIGHRSLASARETAAAIKAPRTVGVFDDLRLMLKESAPEVILMDRPTNVTLEFLLACVEQGIAIFSLGPPVETLAEAQSLAAVLPVRTHLLYIWPRFASSALSVRCAQADDFIRPIRFASASWMGVNYAFAKTFAASHVSLPLPDFPVRSLSVLAWDALSTLIRLMEMPTSLYAVIRGTVPSGSTFADVSGAATLSLRFPNDAAASLALSDRLPAAPMASGDSPATQWTQRHLLLWGSGTLKVESYAYEFRDAEGRLIDAGATDGEGTKGMNSGNCVAEAMRALREFLEQYRAPASPHRGWEHHLEETAAAMEALVVSHRTGQPESPEKFRNLRR